MRYLDFIELAEWIVSKKEERRDEQYQEALHLEYISPSDLPPDKGPFPEPLPNKRVIIIDI